MPNFVVYQYMYLNFVESLENRFPNLSSQIVRYIQFVQHSRSGSREAGFVVFK